MRSIGLRLPIMAMIVLASTFVPGRADEVFYLERAEWIPTASVLAWPTAYVVPSSYVMPTSYVFPTTYATAYVAETALFAPTTYLAPTYYETQFRRRGLFGRRLVETTRAYYIPTTAYYPTTYYFPTTFSSSRLVDAAVVPSEYEVARSNVECCDGQFVASAAPAIRSLPSEQASVTPAPAAPRSPRQRPARIQSEPEEEPISSNVPELPVRESDSRPASPKPTDERASESPPAPPAAIREQSTAGRPSSPGPVSKPATPAAGSNAGAGGIPATAKPSGTSLPPRSPGGVELPLAPADDEIKPAPADDPKSGTGSGSIRRDSQKPVLATPRSLRSELRNVLFGRVKSRGTNEPEEGVRVTITSSSNAFEDRVALSDAFGRFAVKVPDGDWVVNVTMPSGRVYPVSEITVSNGLITDTIGRDIPSLVITR